MHYFRPIAQTDLTRPEGALTLAGGWCWFDRVEVLTRSAAPVLIRSGDVPAAVRERLTAPRLPMAGLTLDRPRLMGILNVTPDSFSDGGRFEGADAAVAMARHLAETADMIDIGGESTRPGSATVAPDTEIARTVPVIERLRAEGLSRPISIDTRKAAVAQAALAAGADLVNDVSALTFDLGLGRIVAKGEVPVCLMHAQGDPATMQDDPHYDDVLLDVYDFLEARISAAEALGISRSRILVDPGIGFGKTVAHNLALIRGLSVFHGLGCAILLGASRKRFIGTVGGVADTDERGPGTIAVTLAAVAQGVQLHRVHDSSGVRQALRLWRAATDGELG
jgi:dihydropteroate synthase